jgi:hypothetical protein
MRKYVGTSAFIMALLVFSGFSFATPVCAPTQTIVSGTFTGGAVLSQSGNFCTEGIYTFSNFTVSVGADPSGPIPNWTLATGPATSSTGLVLDFAYTNLGTTGDDFQLTFDVMPGIGSETLTAGPSVTVTELICSVATGAGGSCPGTVLTQNPSFGASNGGSSFSNVTLAGTDFVFKDIANGSDVSETINPEPVTFSLMGLGLFAIWFAGRKRPNKA